MVLNIRFRLPIQWLKPWAMFLGILFDPLKEDNQTIFNYW